MLSDFLHYYLFDYEIEVYHNHTDLKDKMIKEKMEHFFRVLMSDDDNDTGILGITACFYDENGVTAKYISNNSLKVLPLKNNTLVNKYSKMSCQILILPYFLFENDQISALKKRIDKDKLDLFKSYKEYNTLKSSSEFLWRDPIWANNIRRALGKLKDEADVFKKEKKHKEAYQMLFCLIVFKKNLNIGKNEKSKQAFADAFALTIKEWGLDILRQDVIKQGTKAAVSAIMSRNMSHNIGSHAVTLWNMQLNEQLKGKSYIEQGKEPLKSVKNSKELFQYLQHRMDFIAEVSTSLPSSEMTMDFKNDVMRPFVSQKVLLDNIAASENIHLTKNDIEYETIPKDCERVSIPNGIIGTHAVYSIFENFIRNAAKHYKGRDGNFRIKVELKIADRVKLKNESVFAKNGKYEINNGLLKVYKNGDTTYTLTKIDQENIRKLFTSKKDKKTLDRFFYIHERYIEMRIWDMRNGSCDKETIINLRGYIDSNNGEGQFIDADGRIKPKGWGFKEMRTSANFLRKNPTDELIEGIAEKEALLMEIVCDDTLNGFSCEDSSTRNCHRGNNLIVRFYLRKPKDMLVIGKDLEDEIRKDKFEIDFSSDNLKKDELLKDEIPHRLLLVPNDIEKDYTTDPKAPMRIMKYAGNIEIDDKYYLSKYEEFIKNIINDKKELPKLCYGGGRASFDDYKLCNDVKKHIKRCIDGNQVSPADCISDNNVSIFFRHAEDAKEKDTVQALIKNKVYFQRLSGGTTSALKLSGFPTDPLLQKHFFLELIESTLTKVVIIDERISDFAGKDAFHDKKVRDILANMKIYVVEVDKEKLSAETLIKNYKKLNSGKSHFLIVHQGILDKLEKNKSKSSSKLLKAVKCSWKVIDSGRGVPHEMEQFKDFRFVEISALLKMLETYDKHALVQTLFSLRRPTIQENGE